jgi:glutamine amidotransferase
MKAPRSPLDLVLIDGGGSNIASVQAAFARLGVHAELSCDHERIGRASHLLLPGVGAAAPAMQRLRELGLDRLIPTLTQPLLGVCLGMQLLFTSSAESNTDCLGLIPGRVQRLVEADCGRVPHIGWNQLQALTDAPLLAGLEAAAYAYFVHSYVAPVGPATVATCDYGGAFSAVVSWRNFHGVQFHPERSAAVGARILGNFLALT